MQTVEFGFSFLPRHEFVIRFMLACYTLFLLDYCLGFVCFVYCCCSVLSCQLFTAQDHASSFSVCDIFGGNRNDFSYCLVDSQEREHQ